jgi:flagellar motor switch protein FliM
MPNVLTQKELDSLLKPFPKRTRRGRPDRGPCAFTKDQLHVLTRGFHLFGRNFSSVLSSHLRVAAKISYLSTRKMDFIELIGRLEGPRCLSPFSVKPAGGTGLLDFSLSVAFPMVDRLLGGRGGPNAPVRPLTQLETGLMTSVVRLCLDTLESSWRSAEPVKFVATGIVPVHQTSQLASEDAPAMVASFGVRLPGTAGTLLLALPLQFLDRIDTSP